MGDTVNVLSTLTEFLSSNQVFCTRWVSVLTNMLRFWYSNIPHNNLLKYKWNSSTVYLSVSVTVITDALIAAFKRFDLRTNQSNMITSTLFVRYCCIRKILSLHEISCFTLGKTPPHFPHNQLCKEFWAHIPLLFLFQWFAFSLHEYLVMKRNPWALKYLVWKWMGTTTRFVMKA